MKTSQASIPPVSNFQKKEQQGQLKQLIESYCYQVGADIVPITQAVFGSGIIEMSNYQSNQKPEQKTNKIRQGQFVLVTTGIVLLCTMVGIFDESSVLMFGLFWGFVFTRYQDKLGHELTQMLLYWMIFGLMSAMENILSVGLFFIPFYHSLKLFFIIALLYPKINLKNKICKEYFLPRLKILSQSIEPIMK